VQELGADVELAVGEVFLQARVLDLELDEGLGDLEFLLLAGDELGLEVGLGLDEVVELGLHFLHALEELLFFVVEAKLLEVFFNKLLLQFSNLEVETVQGGVVAAGAGVTVLPGLRLELDAVLAEEADRPIVIDHWEVHD
jgi:hypothetical protein